MEGYNEPKPPKAEGYQIGELVEQGQYGKTYKALKELTQEYFLMKVVKCVDAEGNSIAGAIRMEIAALKQLTHPLLAQYREYFEEGDNIHIFMDLGSGTALSKVITRRNKVKAIFPLAELLELFIKIIDCVEYLHREKISHKDLKPDNIFMTQEGEGVKIANLGLSTTLGPFNGTQITCYSPPELLSDELIDQDSDVWALGAILYELVTMVKAYSAITPFELGKKIQGGEYDQQLLETNNCPKEIIALIKGMMMVERKNRYTLQEVKKRLEELRMGMMKKEPIKKIAEPVYEELKEIFPEEADILNMEEINPFEMQIVWVDSQVNSENNKKYQEELQKCSNIKVICYKKSEELSNLMNKQNMKEDIILISGGNIYKEIKKLAEKSNKVIIITIFDTKFKIFEAFEIHPKVIAVTDNYSQIENIIKNLGSYLNSQIVWFDPQINIGDNNYSHKLLRKSSRKSLICIDNPEEVKNLINSPRIIPNIILISSGGRYKEIKEAVENSVKVRMVIIFCYKRKTYIHYKTEHIKVWDVVDTMPKVIDCIREGWRKYIRHQRFGEVFTERTFYIMDDYEFLMKNISLITSVHEGINIFYPLGFSAVYKQRIPALRKELNNILKEVVPLVMEEDEIDGQNMKDRLNDLLSYEITPEAILRTYIKEGLYLKFNEYSRSGEGEKVAMFREFAFFLRGSMSHLGQPIIDPNTKVYRGLTLPIHFADYWTQNKGKLILLPAYTSTSKKESEAKKFIDLQGVENGERKVFLEIRFVDNQDIFLEEMEKLTKEEELYQGLYHGVDIAKYSAIPTEEEVLLPPLYPLLIEDIEQSRGTDKMLTVRCLAPLVLSFGQPRGRLCIDTGGILTEEGELREAIVNKMIKLLELGILTTLNLSMGGVNNIDMELFGELVKTIIPSKNLLEVNFFGNGLGSEHAKHICEILKNNKSIKKIDLKGNYFSLEDADVIAEGLKNRKESLLKLRIGGNKFGVEGGKIIWEALRRHNLIQEISFSGTDIGERAGELAEVLKGFKELKILDVWTINLSGSGMKKIVEAVVEHPIQILGLADNPVGGEGMRRVCQLLRYIPTLTLLHLDDTGCDHRVALPLSQLFQNSTSMEVLSLRDNKIGSEGCVTIVQALRQHQKLKQLNLDKTGIEREGMGIIIEELGEHHRALDNLGLGCGYIGGENAGRLAHAITKFNSLSVLGLNVTNLEADDIELILKSIMQLKTLKVLALGDNNIGNKTELIGELLQSNRNPLRILWLTSCKIEDEGGKIILEGLRQNNTLRTLALNQNNISGGLKKEFDTLGEERGMEIKLDKPMEGTNFLEELQGLINAFHVDGQGEEGEGERGEHLVGHGMQMMMQALGGLLMQTDHDEEEEGEEEKKDDCTQFQVIIIYANLTII